MMFGRVKTSAPASAGKPKINPRGAAAGLPFGVVRRPTTQESRPMLANQGGQAPPRPKTVRPFYGPAF